MNAKILEAKKQKVEQLNSLLKTAKTVVVVSYSGISVSDISQLRHALKEVNARLSVQKNTLLRKAVDEDGLSELDTAFKGPSAIVTSDEECGGLKEIEKFASEHQDKFAIKAGVINGVYCDEAMIKEYAAIGSKENALSMLLSTLSSPLTQLALTLKAYGETLK